MFSRACHWSRVSPTFPALANGYMFSRAWDRLGGYTFSFLWHPCHVFPRLTPVVCLPAHVNGFPRLLWPPHLFGLLHYLKPLATNFDFDSIFEEYRNFTNIVCSFQCCIIYCLSCPERHRHQNNDWIWFHKIAEETHSGPVRIDSITSAKQRVKLGCLAAFRVHALRVSGDLHGLVKRNAQTLCSHWWRSRFQILLPEKKK